MWASLKELLPILNVCGWIGVGLAVIVARYKDKRTAIREADEKDLTDKRDALIVLLKGTVSAQSEEIVKKDTKIKELEAQIDAVERLYQLAIRARDRTQLENENLHATTREMENQIAELERRLGDVN